ncbi:uncharacterized protein Z520_07017 [Fonsecaea multimorphosa CBS 102226]|uniref:Uncharacterized protein n=1 Tax=Fonsecaea multimorphosa CBS 102226 TaxID=1442371 RepID=A0A0D2K360_9EURO|nr:uncharacterized protein Z520_07017 [Fonsecaea multimorphosa CBS 102226]KIX97564.1 hypothetical protein Z520_07017 [Fonsecaea multimorphosa CBS 102226]OAL23521.1 hypothetical protein AYO22_06571 [Fonsecaea multimorphosa]
MGSTTRSTFPGEGSFQAESPNNPAEAPCISVSFVMSSTRHLVTVGVEVVDDEFFERNGHCRDRIPQGIEATFDPNTARWAVQSDQAVADHPPPAPRHIPAPPPVNRRAPRKARKIQSPSSSSSSLSQAHPAPCPGPGPGPATVTDPVVHHPDTHTDAAIAVAIATATATAATAELEEKLSSSPVTSGQTRHKSNPQDAPNQPSTSPQANHPVQENGDCRKIAKGGPTTIITTSRRSDWWSVVF